MLPPAPLKISPDLHGLSLFRIGLALYLLVDFSFNLLPHFEDFFGDQGILPLAALAQDRPLPVIVGALRAFEQVGLRAALPVAYPLALLALLVGWRTRWACVIAYAFELYLYWRNPLIKSGAEDLGHLLLLWSCFLPLNRYWSVDAALDPQDRDRPAPVVPVVAIRLQIAALYLFSALFKLAGQPWLAGAALGQALGDTVFGGRATGLFLLEHAGALLPAVNWAVIAFQLAFPFLVYCPWRNDVTRAIALAGAAAMHLSFIVCLNVGGFPYLCFVMLFLLLPDHWIVGALARRRARLARVAIYYEPECGFCRRVSLLLREFLLPPATPVLPASSDAAAAALLAQHRSWVVRDAAGGWRLKWQAVAYVLRQHPLTAPLGWLTDLPALRPAAARLYDWIGDHRTMFGRLTAPLLPFRAERPLARPWQVLCGGLAALALVANIASLPAGERRAWLDPVIDTLQVGQRWSLFAPIPTRWRWDFRFQARDDDAAEPLMPRLTHPPLAAQRGAIAFASHRWLKYFTRLGEFSDADWRALGGYLCRRAATTAHPPTTIEVALVVRPVAGAAGPALAPTERVISCPSGAPAAPSGIA